LNALSKVQELKQRGFCIADIAELTGLTQRQVKRRLGIRPKPKAIKDHIPDTEYLKDIPQIPDEAVQMMAGNNGRDPTPELERECEKVIWEIATIQIRKVAPKRSERFLLRYRKVFKLLGTERRGKP
jgi:hypothetical protein